MEEGKSWGEKVNVQKVEGFFGFLYNFSKSSLAVLASGKRGGAREPHVVMHAASPAAVTSTAACRFDVPLRRTPCASASRGGHQRLAILVRPTLPWVRLRAWRWRGMWRGEDGVTSSGVAPADSRLSAPNS